MFCDVREHAIIESTTVDNIYELPLILQGTRFPDNYALHKLNIDLPEADMSEWKAMIEKAKHLEHHLTIGLVGKYVQLHDAYLSVHESLKHAGLANNADITIRWINSEDMSLKDLEGVDGIIVPGGFGGRGVEGMINASKYARENNIPYFGICLGMQIASIDIARHPGQY